AAVAGFLFGGGVFAFLRRSHGRGAAGAAEDLGDGEIQFADGEIDVDDGDFDDIADADFFAGALAADLAGAFIDIPPIIEELFVADETVDQVFADLHEEAEVGDAGDDAGKVFADAFLEQLEDFYLAQFALGIVGAA